ncbi:MAG: PQQ-binding-like beta-propeller repeat protein [Fimbriimonas sp.]|nr:PQQ-binding-like beta-propeller repeat protein [Fimbriimonas sp.]
MLAHRVSLAKAVFLLIAGALTSLSLGQVVSSVTVTPTSVVGGFTATGTVKLTKAAPSGGILVPLSSSASYVSLPLTASIVAGAKSGTFTVTTSPVTATKSATIKATIGGVSKSASISVKAASLQSVAMLPPTISSGDSSIGSVSLSGGAPSGGLVVLLKSSSPKAKLPASVTVPAGFASASFVVSTQSILQKSTAVVTAKLGSAAKTVTLTIDPAVIGDLFLSPGAVLGGNVSTATVSLNGMAPQGGFAVSLSTSNTAITNVPKMVVIPAGSNSASVTVTTSSVVGDSSAVIAASGAGGGASASLSILGASITAISTTPSSIVGGGTARGTLTLSTPAPVGGSVVSLTSSSSNARVPNSVTVAAGFLSGTFPITTVAVPANTSTTITAMIGNHSLAISLAITKSVVLADSGWPKFHGNAQNTGQATGSGALGNKKWSVNTAWVIGSSSPALAADGTVYCGSWDSNVYAISSSGIVQWTYPTGNPIFCDPTVGADGTIYISSTDNFLYALNPNGTLKWKFESGGFGNSAPAIAPDGTIYVGSYDNNLYALNPDGSQKWTYNIGNASDSGPAIGADGTIYVGSDDDVLYAISPYGHLNWAFVTGNVITASPAIGPDGTIYITSQDHYLYALDSGGNIKWVYGTGDQIWSSPAVGSDGTVFFGSRDGYLYAVKPNGSLKWKFATGAEIRNASPSLGGDGVIYIGSRDNFLYAVNSDGSLKWKFATGSWIDSSPAIGKDGTVYIGSNDHQIYAIH